MKKLIISAITAAALLFGFASCSGDLHDDEKGGASQGSGSWYYISAGTPDGAPTIIFNNANKQTANLANTKSSGNVFFKIDTTKEVDEEDFGTIKKRWACEEIDEAAAKKLGWEDKKLSGLAIYVYAEIDPVKDGLKVYTHSPECFGVWSGKPMSNDGALLKEFTANVKVSFDVSDYEKATGKKIGTIFITGNEFNWRYPEAFGWSAGKGAPDGAQFVKKGSEFVYTYKTEAVTFPETSPEFQFVLFEEGVDAKNASSSDLVLQSDNCNFPLKDNSNTPYADFQNKRYENGATINILVKFDGSKKPSLKLE